MLLTFLPNQLIGNRWLTLARNGTLAAAEERAAAMSVATATEYTALLAAGDPGRAARPAGDEPAQSRVQELVILLAGGSTHAQIAAQPVPAVVVHPPPRPRRKGVIRPLPGGAPVSEPVHETRTPCLHRQAGDGRCGHTLTRRDKRTQ